MFLFQQVHVLLECTFNTKLSAYFAQLCLKIREMFLSNKHIRPFLVMSSVDVVVLPNSVMDGAVLFLTPLRAEDSVVILRETFTLGSDWNPNPILLQTLTDLAGPPRLLLGLLCQAGGMSVDLFREVVIETVRAKLRDYGDSATQQGLMRNAQQAEQLAWLSAIYRGFEPLNMGSVANTMQSLYLNAQLHL